MHALAHVLNDEERAEVIQIGFAATGGTRGAHFAVDVKPRPEDWRVTDPPRNFPREAARRRHTANLAFGVDPIAIDRAVNVSRIDEAFGDHLAERFAAGFCALLRI